MESVIGVLIMIFLFFIIQVALVRWVLRVNHIVMILEQAVTHLEEMKKQNNVLIKQQDEIMELLEANTEVL
ncbi:MAG: hypothetical protein AB3A66_08700 [Nodularia sp. CChRGM 3473]